MIFFMINRLKEQKPYSIPLVSTEVITESNIQIISWNEACCVLPDSIIQFINLDELKKAVFYEAQTDPLCININCQFKTQYRIDIFEAYHDGKHKFHPVIDNIFDFWAHPMIGNILVSSGMRPQTKEDQYLKNWDSFPAQYMNEETKGKIKAMMDVPRSAGLKNLMKSSRDQVRICRDMMELARAIIGEISTWATKKLEKIYALELCSSPKLLQAQRQLIREILPKISLEQHFNFIYTEYIYFYLPNLKTLKKDYQWSAFVQLLEDAIESKSKLVYVVPEDPIVCQIIENAREQFKKIPPTMRCAMFINYIRKAEGSAVVTRYSLAAVQDLAFLEDQNFLVKCDIREAAGKEFIPELVITEKKKALLWSWNRDEKHIATMTYRHYLMPLWAGPSGHTTGIIEFYTSRLNKYIKVGAEDIPVSFIILPTMFSFWRLYYDKRISGVHTLAETYEAAYSLGIHEVNGKLSTQVQNTRSGYIEYEGQWILAPVSAYEDSFDTLKLYPDGGPNMTGIVNSVRIMAQIKHKYYKEELEPMEAIQALDMQIDQMREKIERKDYEIPQWSKPVIVDPQSQKTLYDQAFQGMVIRSYSNLNVRTFHSPAPVPQQMVCSSGASEKLIGLYQKILSTETYCFSEDFSGLPMFLLGAEKVPFLAAVTFTDIKNGSLDESGFTFTAMSVSDARFWEAFRMITPVKDIQEISCTVIEDEDRFDFTGIVKTDIEIKITDRLAVHIDRLGIKSILEGDFSDPYVFALAEIGSGTDTIAVTIVISPASGLLYISGVYRDGKILTMNHLFSLLGIDNVIPVSVVLPDEESIFGSLGLRDISMTVSMDDVALRHLNFTITAENPWNIFDDKITLQPYFEIAIEYPFDSRYRQIDYTVLGKWTLGKTVFDISYRSNQIIKAQLAKDSVLNFAEAAELFAKDIKFPEIKLNDMEMTLDAAGGNYSLYLFAEDMYKFCLGKGEAAIEDVSFALDFRDGRFDDVLISGALSFGGLSFYLSGTYYENGSFSFEAAAYSENAYSLGAFLKQIAQELSENYDPGAFPEELLIVSIRKAIVSYQSKDSELLAYVSLENILKISDKFSIQAFTLEILSSADTPLSFEITADLSVCGTEIALLVSKEEEGFVISGNAEFTDLTFQKIADEFGIDTKHLPEFVKEFSVFELELKYNFTKKVFCIMVNTSAGEISAEIISGDENGFYVSYKTAPSVSVNMLELPLAGELVRPLLAETSDFSVKDFEIRASSKQGVMLGCMVFGTACRLELYQPDTSQQRNLMTASGVAETVKWFSIDKTFAILTIPKIGIGLDEQRVVILLDAALNVSPFSFVLTGAGVGADLTKLSDIKFYLSGFGIAFDNGTLAIGGSFSRTQEDKTISYAGSMLIKFKALTAEAIGEYSSGSLMAYLAISAPIGGPPAFFVTGLALGFGYNKKLVLPGIEEVPEYPLITAASSGFNQKNLSDLKEYIKDQEKQKFLTVGVKFTSFKMIHGFLLLDVSFGNHFELGVLGIAEVFVPPNVSAAPIAKAQLAVKANYDPSKGVISVEAQLTSESYIFCRSCRLSGGFAAYFWFDNSEYSGDFVVTLGGYHPAFQKPEYYPVVPRLGLDWNVDSYLKISGELYFALTPGAVMAGGKLSAVYSQGNLKAWFIAYADFIMAWKPFSYRASIGVTIGASYRIDWWFIHKTFSIELAAELTLWGPEVQGRVHISWFIISFTISFSTGKDHSKEAMDWNNFKDSFLTDKADKRRDGGSGDTDILTLVVDGSIGKALDGADIIDGSSFAVSLSSQIPENGNIRPVNSVPLQAEMEVKISDSSGRDLEERFIKTPLTRNVPAALWKREPGPGGSLKEESAVQAAVCGVLLQLHTKTGQPELFPRTRYISLEELYKKNTLEFSHCYCFLQDVRMHLSWEDSIHRFTENEAETGLAGRRKKFLEENGITESVDIQLFAENAENWLSEDILIL
ncbi:Uncharacterised protein [uncultured Roseburia sp.]|uniref:DUF6603 domain-containing protein n=1 Tax=Brotonthovivens ammoniilytica TaxID=2981725 RepID=A0ABT2TH04_9FIRM|nr:DUF6603 domain-containing protein [Brotonthovivens ammoniilytica]MCU6761186.1 hypothetical protein [Brotonthovivens ammoniilytica]SCI21369.1 Uncharacterised protein [uncultured Roseburia sp.]